MSVSLGLRDRKKAATKAALGAAAASLTRELGLDAVTGDAIANQAGVSTRTFHNYFASKEEAVIFHLEESLNRWVQRLDEVDESLPILDAMELVCREMASSESGSLDEMIAISTLVRQNPTLLAHKITTVECLPSPLLNVIARRSGTSSTDLYPRLLAQVISATFQAAIDQWLTMDQNSDLTELIGTAFLHIREGFRLPGTTTAEKEH